MNDPTITTPGEAAPGFRFGAGTTLAGRYEVVRALGRGGIGEVYEVRDTQMGEVVALKVLSERLSGDAVALSRFQAEAKNARRITHPNVCRIHDFGVHGEGEQAQHFLTMELLRGETLEARMKRAPLSRPDVLEVFRQIAAGVDAAHAVGIVHRDLKPSNVMLVSHVGGGTRAVVTDFGLARQEDESRITSEGWVGTPAYVAPEQIEGEAGDRAADVYALGVMLFEAAVGRLPFEAATGGQVALQRLARPAPRARSVDATIPAAWDEAIARCLEQKPEQRFVRASEAVRAMAGEAGTSGAPSVPWARRRGSRSAVWVGALAACVLAAALAVGLLRDRLFKPPLPADIVVSIQVELAPGAEAPKLPAQFPPFGLSVADVVRQEWQRLEEPRRFRVSPDASGNLTARLEWSGHFGAVHGALVLRAGAWSSRVIESTAPSIRELADALYPAVAEILGRGRPAVELFPEERQEMDLWGAPSAQAYKDLRNHFVSDCGQIVVDDEASAAEWARLATKYASWPHVALMDVTHRPYAERAAAARQYLALAASTSDKAGLEVLRSIVEDPGLTAARRAIDATRGDMILDWVSTNDFSLPPDELTAAYRRVADRYPRLQAGATVYAGLVGEGFKDGGERYLQAWLGRVPGLPQAWLSMITHLCVDQDASPLDVAPSLSLLFGDGVEVRTVLAAIHLARSDLPAARELANQLLAGPLEFRVEGLSFLAAAHVFSGQFIPAHEKALRALELAQGLKNLPAAQMFLAWTRAPMKIEIIRRHDREANVWRRRLVERWARQDWPVAERVALEYQALKVETARCPDGNSMLQAISDPSVRIQATRMLSRAAAEVGCGTCEAVLEAGRSTNEDTLPWSTVFARCAVELDRSLNEASAVLKPAERYRSTLLTNAFEPSPVDVVLAHYWMGRLHEKKGQPAEARAKYERFLQFWGAADVPIPEVDDARRRLAGMAADAR